MKGKTYVVGHACNGPDSRLGIDAVGNEKEDSQHRRDGDKEKWKELAASPGLGHLRSKREKAEKIAKRLSLPLSAIETIRKTI